MKQRDSREAHSLKPKLESLNTCVKKCIPRLYEGIQSKIFCQDNAGENVELVKMAKGKKWKLEFEVEYAARKTPQQNLHAATLFTIIAAQARCMMIAGQIPDTEQFKLWPEAVKTATLLNNLVHVTIGGVTQTCWEHAGYKVPKWTKTLQTFGEAKIMKDGKKGKVLNRGLTMIFVGYS
jgi:hypothetical protein